MKTSRANTSPNEAENKNENKITTKAIANRIYEISKKADAKELNNLLSSAMYYYVDVYASMRMAINQITAEQDVPLKALHFLIKQSDSGALQGYGMHHLSALAIAGIAERKPIDRTLLDPFILSDGLSDAVSGAASAGYIGLTGELINKGAWIERAVFCAAENGHDILTVHLIMRGASIENALSGAAAGNQNELLHKIIHIGGSHLYNLADTGISRASASHGNEELTYHLIDEHGASLNQAALGAGEGNHVKLLDNLIQRGASLDHAVSGAARGNHIELVNNLFARGASSMEGLIWGASLQEGGSFDKKTISLLKFMARLSSSDLRTKFVEAVKADSIHKGKQGELVASLLEDANRLGQLMQTRNLSFVQASVWQLPEIQVGFSYFTFYLSLPIDVFFIIADYLLLDQFNLFSRNELKDLCQKILPELRIVDLGIDLENHYLNSSFIPLLRDNRPLKFKSTCQKAVSVEALRQTIEVEIQSLTSMSGTYFDLLNRHLSQLPKNPYPYQGVNTRRPLVQERNRMKMNTINNATPDSTLSNGSVTNISNSSSTSTSQERANMSSSSSLSRLPHTHTTTFSGNHLACSYYNHSVSTSNTLVSKAK